MASRRGLHFPSPWFAHLQSGDHNVGKVRSSEYILLCKLWHFLELLSSSAAPFSWESEKPGQSAPRCFCSVATELHLGWLTLPCSVGFVRDLTGSRGLCAAAPKQGMWIRWFQKGAVGWADFLKLLLLLYSLLCLLCVQIGVCFYLRQFGTRGYRRTSREVSSTDCTQTA